MGRKLFPVGILLGTLLAVVAVVTAVAAVANPPGSQRMAVAAGLRGHHALPGPTAVITGGNSCANANLLANPGFEGDYTKYIIPAGHPDCQDYNGDGIFETCERANVPADWHPRWRDAPRDQVWMNIMPEYLASTPDQVNPDRVRSGGKSLHYFAFFSTHETAVHQQVTVTAGTTYCFSAYGHAWTDRISEDFYSATPDRPNDDGQLFQKVGIDPTGGTDWQAATVIWSPARKQYDLFGEFVVTATAQAPTVTVFLYSINTVPVRFNDVYWDDAWFSFDEPPQTLAVSPPQIGVIATITDPVTVTQPIVIDLTPGLTWTASLSPAGTITPLLSALTGTMGTHLSVTITTQGLVTGTYTTTLHIDAGAGVTGSPAWVPVTVFVVPEIHRVALPSVAYR